jgi:hypothetical protein
MNDRLFDEVSREDALDSLLADQQLANELREQFEDELLSACLSVPDPRQKELLFNVYCSRFLLSEEFGTEGIYSSPEAEFVSEKSAGPRLSQTLSKNDLTKDARFSIENITFQRKIYFEDSSEIVFYRRDDGSFFVAIHKLEEETAKKLDLLSWYRNYVQSAGSSFGMISDPEKVDRIIEAVDDPLLRL